MVLVLVFASKKGSISSFSKIIQKEQVVLLKTNIHKVKPISCVVAELTSGDDDRVEAGVAVVDDLKKI